jgi:hypothetical protein
MTINDLLNYLDGNGIIFTDEELVEIALRNIRRTLESEI